MDVWIEVDHGVSECGVSEMASWSAQAIEQQAVVDEFNPPWPGHTIGSPSSRIEIRDERLSECLVTTAWMQHYPAEDIEGGEYPNEKMTHLVIDLETGERYYLKRTTEWEA